MDSFLNLKETELDHKNPSPQALRRWRSAALSLVMNRRRRFRIVADLDKRNEAEQIKQGIKVSIQITRWLLQPVVWRIVGFASTIIGMFCYALSSSFKHLFGDWNLLKIFLYSVFSSIICLLILFAKVWQCSTNLLSKANMTFWVLTITSVYSFVYDKAVNGKPDIYSLISCGAFAIMSLSLSRQTRFGFEVDLLYFFLGCLIIQLMKIKWLLVIPGAGFSYSLINLRYTLDAAAESGYHGLTDHIVIQVDSLVHNTSNASPENGHLGLQDNAVTQLTNVDSHAV